ncbi:hypothetical protein F2Q68_00000623 [Brassica cretica]|uniref:Uncharacterized protein n=1 Tax=Brassica cretica TaxID=69181 RepID=A0A8S9JDW6_BRACR|nr:hypothetical protein F2Q68_00000623 [Brassica cretica]
MIERKNFSHLQETGRFDGFQSSSCAATNQIFRQAKLFATSKSAYVPKGYVLGESQKKRYLVSISFLSQPSFQDMLLG